jgi:hypothetical protein
VIVVDVVDGIDDHVVPPIPAHEEETVAASLADGETATLGSWLPPDQPAYDTAPVPAPVVPVDPADEPQPEPVRQTRSRRVKRTLRIVLFAALFVTIVAVALGGIGYYGRRGYFVTFSGSQVVVKQGQPGGVLWVKPTTARTLPLTRDDLSAKWQDRVASENITFGTLAAAEEWYAAIAENPDAIPALATTTTVATTTTTTVAPTTTIGPVDTTAATFSPPAT